MTAKKSSATKATKKKHAAKGAPNGEAESAAVGGNSRGQKKVKKNRFEVKVKSYTPPPVIKGAVDPVDLYLNNGRGFDAELIVILRKLGKRDEATIQKGVEGLENWIRDLMKEENRVIEDEEWKLERKREEIVSSMAVWAHHFSRLALHPSRRLRLQTLTLHTLLASPPSQHRPSELLTQTRSALLAPLWIEQSEFVGAWCCSAFDPDRAVRNSAMRGWKSVVLLEAAIEGEEKEGINLGESAEGIMSFANTLVLPNGVFDEDNDEPSIRQTQALLAISYLLQTLPSPLILSESTLWILTKPDLWELVKPSEPAMVRRALYELLGSIVERKEVDLISEKDDGVQLVAGWVLRNCWGEGDGWAGIIAFLRRYPQAWTLADEPVIESSKSIATKSDNTNEESDDSGDDNQDEEDDEEETEVIPVVSTVPASFFTPSPTLSLFFDHLSLACTGQPQAYPTILLLISTIPAATLPIQHDSLSLLFESFWSAWGGRALAIGSVSSHATSAIEEFITSLLECLLWQSNSLQRRNAVTAAESLVVEWIGRIWRTYLGMEEDGDKRHKGIATHKVSLQIADTLSKLEIRNEEHFSATWTVIRSTTLQSIQSALVSSLEPLAIALNNFGSSKFENINASAYTLSIESLHSAIKIIQSTQGAECATTLLPFMGAIRETIQNDQETVLALDQFTISTVPQLLSSTTSVLALEFLEKQLAFTTAESRASIWSSVFATALPSSVLLQLIRAVGDGVLPADFENVELDDSILETLSRVLSDESVDAVELEVITRLINQPEPFITTASPLQLLVLVTSRIEELARRALSGSPPPLNLFSPPIKILAHYVTISTNALAVADSEIFAGGVTAMGQVAHLLPHSRIGDLGEVVDIAESAWNAIVVAGGQKVVAAILIALQEQVLDVESHPSPIELVNAASSILSTLPIISPSILADLLPAISNFDSLFPELNSPSSALSVLDPLITLGDIDISQTNAVSVDDAGFTSYVRVVLSILEIAARDHSWARKNLWLLPHVLLVSHAAQDELAIPGSTNIFGSSISSSILQRVIGAAEGLIIYLLSAGSNDLLSGWGEIAIGVLRKGEMGEENTLIGALITLRQGGIYGSRGFRRVVESTLRYSDAGVGEAERWLAFARSLPEGSELSRAIILAIKSVIIESPKFIRYQNELAADLAGVSSSAASTKGFVLLNSLLCTAPPLDAAVIFLPQQRSIFLIQKIQSWIGSEFGLSAEVNCALAELFMHLAPVVQELSGSHWDLFFDIIEFNLETSDWEDGNTLPALYHSTRLLAQIKDLAKSNTELRSTVKSRIDTSLALIRDLFVSRPDSRERSAPRTLILDLMAHLVSDIPEKLLSMDSSFDHLLELLRDTSLSVQQSAYQLASRIVKKHVAELVVTAELETETEIVIEFPPTLISLLSQRLSPENLESEEEVPVSSTFLLSWLLAFQFVEVASPRVKSAYIDQLRKLDLVATSFLPSIFSLLSVGDRTRSFDVSPWSVDDFHLELVDGTSSVTLPVFATYVYYRSLQSLPSLIRTWWDSCKNRQLSNAVANFTSKYFSPVLIAQELSHLRDPDDPTAKTLRDNEDFTIKISSGSNEVKATFIIDEQSMEIGIRVPPEFPLLGVEVKDIQKIGVTDAQWRAWLLAVQQVITTQNGLIAEALSLFKRNVTLHFDGVEPCAICYSVISVVDRSLPNKSCRTCSNTFHAGCLYKWFATSNAATCPLCRSVF